jgi:hypothetical protein
MQTQTSNLCLASSEDEPILAFVRAHLSAIRAGLSYCQIAGGDGVNVVAHLRVGVVLDAHTEPRPNNLHLCRSEDTDDSGRQALQG